MKEGGRGLAAEGAAAAGTVKEQGEMGFEPSQTGCEEWLPSPARAVREHDEPQP